MGTARSNALHRLFTIHLAASDSDTAVAVFVYVCYQATSQDIPFPPSNILCNIVKLTSWGSLQSCFIFMPPMKKEKWKKKKKKKSSKIVTDETLIFMELLLNQQIRVCFCRLLKWDCCIRCYGKVVGKVCSRFIWSGVPW